MGTVRTVMRIKRHIANVSKDPLIVLGEVYFQLAFPLEFQVQYPYCYTDKEQCCWRFVDV